MEYLIQQKLLKQNMFAMEMIETCLDNDEVTSTSYLCGK